MKIILKVSMPILIGLMFYGCQRDFEVFSPQASEANKKHREQDAIKSLFERSYKHGELRSLKPQGMLDYSDFTVHWEHPVRDTLRAGSLLTVAYPMDGLILQRINLETNQVKTIGFSAEGDPVPVQDKNGAFNAPKVKRINTDC